jgi:hydrogenase-4 component B
MQYTAGSFAGTITEWFAWILRPQRHTEPVESTFPAEASHSEHTPEAVLDHLIAPVASVCLQISTAARGLQHGRVQSYLLYLLVGMAALTGLVMIGGPQ